MKIKKNDKDIMAAKDTTRNGDIYLSGLSCLRAGCEKPDYRRYLSAGECRRLSEGLRDAIFAGCQCLEKCGIEVPGGIIAATDSGCMRNTAKFLDDLGQYGEDALKPSYFMYSTHNSFATSIALHLKCHGYNTTHSDGNRSVANALTDAIHQLRKGKADNILLVYAEETPVGPHHGQPGFFAVLVTAKPLARVAAIAEPAGTDDTSASSSVNSSSCTSLCLEEFQSFCSSFSQQPR